MKARFLQIFDRLSRRAGGVRRLGDSYDVVDLAFLKAGLEAAEFYEAHLLHARAFSDVLDMIRDGVHLASPDGLFLEFGVAGGRSIAAIAGIHPGPVYGFDSFEGLPESWGLGYDKGAFAQARLPNVPGNVSLVKGWFSDTLPAFVAAHPGPVSFLHIDCDLYSSTRLVFDLLADRIGPGCVIQFDEFFNYPGWREHEHKAFQELVAARGLKFRYHAFHRSHQAVCVVIE